MRARSFFIVWMAAGGIAATASAAGAQPTGLEVESLEVGQQAPVFVMKEMGTTDYVFSRDYFGELRQEARMKGLEPRTVILSFFATWCKPCGEEMPALSRIAEENTDRGVEVLFVNLGDTDETVRSWLQQHPGIEGKILMDPFAENTKRYGVDALPRTIIIDSTGTVRFIERGFETEGYREKVTGALEDVLGPGP